MKKHIKILLITFFTISTLSLVSCNKQEESFFSNNDIAGTWDAVQMSTNGSNFRPWDHEPTVVSFDSNGTFYMEGYFGSHKGTWKKKGNTIYTYIKDVEMYKYVVLELTSNTCRFKMGVTGLTNYIWIDCVKKKE